MTVPYTSYEAIVLQNAITMLANSTIFQTLVGVTTSTLARAFIIESSGGSDAENQTGDGSATASENSSLALVPPFAEVNTMKLDVQEVGIGVYDHSGSIEVLLIMPRQIPGETAPEMMRRARNSMGSIRSDMEVQFGAGGCLARGSISTEGPFLPNDAGADRDAVVAVLTIDWYA